MRPINLLIPLALGATLATLVSCGDPRPDFGFLVETGRDITPGQPVEWREVSVGTVAELRPDRGQIRVDVRLFPQFQGAMPADLRARVVRGFLDERSRVVLVNAGTTPQHLPKNSLIPTETETPASRTLQTLRQVTRAGREIGEAIQQAIEECNEPLAPPQPSPAPNLNP